MPSLPSPDSSPPPSEDDDDEDRRRGLRRRLDLLNEDAQQRARGRRIRNITHTNTVTTVYEEGEGDLLCAARPPERPAQVRHPHHHHHLAEDVAVAERVDGVDAREQKKRYKNSFLPPTVLVPCLADVEALWLLNENAPRPDVANPPNDNGV